MKSILKLILRKLGIQLNFRIIRLLFDLLTLQKLKGISTGYLPWIEASISPSAVEMILNEIITNDRKVILECGIGVSTIILARFLQNWGGLLLSIEDNTEWIETVENFLAFTGANKSNYQILCAPPNQYVDKWPGI